MHSRNFFPILQIDINWGKHYNDEKEKNVCIIIKNESALLLLPVIKTINNIIRKVFSVCLCNRAIYLSQHTI